MDHYSIIIDTNIKKNKPNIVTKTIRDTTKLSPTHLMEAYTPPIFKPEDTIDQAYNQFKEELLKMLDVVAPQKVIKTTVKLWQPWFNKHIRQQCKVMNNGYHAMGQVQTSSSMDSIHEKKEISTIDSLSTIRSKQCQRRYWRTERTPNNCVELSTKWPTAINKTYFQMKTLENLLKNSPTTSSTK